MKGSNFEVLLFSDGSHQAFSAAVYTATLLKKIPNMSLTILQVHETDKELEGATEYSWMELRPKYKRYQWGRSEDNDYRWIDSWPAQPNQEWMRGVLNESETSLESQVQYAEILRKTNEIYRANSAKIKHQALYLRVIPNEPVRISETAKMILDYVDTNSFNLIIMGMRGYSFKGLINGSLARTVLEKSPLPILLIKKLPQAYIDRYLAAEDL